MSTGPSEVNPRDMMRGIENVGEGWRPIVRDLERTLMDLDSDYSVMQVKEKFGGLRYYPASTRDYSVDDPFWKAISEAESLSFKTCEQCGSTEEVECRSSVGGHWIKTLCATCRVADEARLAG